MKKTFLIISLTFILGGFFLKTPIVIANDITNDVVEEGIYELYTYVNDTKVIEVIGSSKIDGANVDIYERGNQDNQKFQLKVNKDGTYTFFAIHSNKVLDISMADGNVSQYELHGGDNQKWYIKQTSDGYCNIISKANGKYLDVEKAQGKDCQNIQVNEGHGGSSQKFKLVKIQNIKGNKIIEDGIYHIKSQVADNRFLEIPNSQTKDEANIQTGKENNLANQKFEIIYNNDGTYSITVLHSGKLLEVQNGSGKNETPVVQYTKKEGNSQKWVMIKNNNNTYSLIATCNGLALDVKSANINVGATLQTYYFHGQKSQQFTFELCKPETGSKTVEDGTYRILSTINDKKVWEIAYSSRENGANVLMWENTKSVQQKFDIEYVGEGYYKIKSKISNKVLTVESENPKTKSFIGQQ